MSPSPPDLFPERPIRSDFARAPSYRTRRIITILVLIGIIGFGIHYIFGGASIMHSGEIATIKAEGGWKQRPEQPGGLDIPNQNVQVYQALDNKNDSKEPADHLMPPPETPQPVTTTAAQPKPSNVSSAPPTTPQIENLTPPKLDIDSIPMSVTDAPAPAAAPVAPAVSTAPITSPSAPAAVVAPIVTAPEAIPVPDVTATPAAPSIATAPKSVPKAAVVKTKPSTSPPTIAQVLKDVGSGSKTDRAVQLASVPDEAAAQSMAKKLQSQYASVLGSAQLHLVEADIEGKGTFYRIQSSPLSDERANAICAELKKMKAGCILVRP